MLFGRVSRITFDIVGTLVVLLVLGIGILGWRLSMGPISLSFLTPLVEQALSDADSDVAISVDDTVLTWGGWSRTFDIRVLGMRALGKDGRLMLEMPEVSLGLSTRALLIHGLLAPTSLEAIGGQLVIIRSADGAWHFSSGSAPGSADDSAASAMPLLLGELLAPPDATKSLGYLRRASVVNAAVSLVDEASQRVWVARDATIIVRRDEEGLRAEMAAMADLEAKPTAISGDAIYHAGTGTLDANVHIAHFDPASLAKADPSLAPLAGVVVPLAGEISASFDERFRVTKGAFHFAGSQGKLDAATLHLPRDAEVRRVSLRGRLPEGLSVIELEEAQIDLGGPVVSVHGRISGLEETPHVQASLTARDMPTNSLRSLWPEGAGENARRWIVEHLSNGRVTEAKADVAASARPNGAGWQVEHLGGTMAMTGIDVSYLPPMPAVNKVDGTATFDASRFDIAVSGGGFGGLRVTKGAIALYALDTPVELADIDITVAGPLQEQLALVDHAPLGYLKRIDLKAEDFGGDATTRLMLKFPLKKALKVDELDVTATGEVTGLKQARAALGQDVTDGVATVRVDRNGLDINGQVQLGPVAAKVDVRRNFADNAPIVARTRAQGRVASSGDRKLFGFDLLPYIDIAGATTLSLDYIERRGGRSDLALDATLDESALSVPLLDWSKASGKKASAKVTLTLIGGTLASIPKFTVDAGDPMAGGLFADGKLDFTPDGKSIARAELASLQAGLSDAHGTWARSSDGIAVDVAGKSFDVGPFMRDTEPRDPNRAPLTLKVAVDRLYFAPDRWLNTLSFDGRRGKARWDRAELEAHTGPEMRLTNQVALSLRQDAAGLQTLEARAEDAGAFLKALDITQNMVGGRLEVKAATDAKRPSQPLAGHLHISEHRIVNAPMLARVLSVALLTGLFDSLSGEGIRFARLDADFAYADPVVEISEGQASGSALGITAKGKVDIDAETIDLDGTVVPANAINSLLGRIPLVGNILTGGGGGVFAANYSMKGAMADPKVSVNALSALAPGFLRNLFGNLPGTSPTDATPESERQIDQQRPARPQEQAPPQEKPATPP